MECQGLHKEGKCIASPCLNCVSKKNQEVLEVVALTFCKIIANLQWQKKPGKCSYISADSMAPNESSN